MGKLYEGITPELAQWMEKQPLFFVGTAPLAASGGAETIAHVRENGRVVLTFCAFAGAPKTMRVGDSCGCGVPTFSGMEPRAALPRWAENKGGEALRAYRRQHNARSIDGLAALEAAHEEAAT